jgi:hypothetical protein
MWLMSLNRFKFARFREGVQTMSKVVLLLLAWVISAEAATTQLYQSGWDAGGPLTIEFTGDDLNGNGGIDTEELLAFTASFTLPGGSMAVFSQTDLGSDGFFFGSTADYFIKADGPDYSLYEIASPGATIAFVSDSLGAPLALSGDPLQESPTSVPEPGSVSLLSLPLIALMIAGKSTPPRSPSATCRD